MGFMFRTLKKCKVAICQRFLWALKQYCEVKQYRNLTRGWVMLLLAAAQGLEIFAQPTPTDLLRILLAVLLWKGQVLVPGQGPNCWVLGLKGSMLFWCWQRFLTWATPKRSPWNNPKYPLIGMYDSFFLKTQRVKLLQWLRQGLNEMEIKNCKLVLEQAWILWLDGTKVSVPLLVCTIWHRGTLCWACLHHVLFICILYGKSSPCSSPFYLGNDIFEFR